MNGVGLHDGSSRAPAPALSLMLSAIIESKVRNRYDKSERNRPWKSLAYDPSQVLSLDSRGRSITHVCSPVTNEEVSGCCSRRDLNEY